jgi:small-conductance mechanosensitive channel
MDPEIVAIKVGFLLAVIAIALVIQHFVVKGINKLAEKYDRLRQGSIIENIVRVTIWVIAIIACLEPVFGIKPSALIASLGIVSIAVSLGLKDTISNLIGGMTLMLSDVISVGDYVTIDSITGTVTDLSWRHTVVTNRLGDRVVIPNSVLNTTAIVRLPQASESRGTVEFTMEPTRDTDKVARDMYDTITGAGIEELSDDPELKTSVFFESITPYGIKGYIYFYVKEGIPQAGVKNKIVRALSDKPYFTTIASGTGEEKAEQA